MPSYDYLCHKCMQVFQIEKGMSAPDPSRCPLCKSRKIDRYFGGFGTSDPSSAPTVGYTDRPPWTYKECLKYKHAKWNDGPRVKIDPSKHGDLGAWHSPGEVCAPTKSDIINERKKRQRKG